MSALEFSVELILSYPILLTIDSLRFIEKGLKVGWLDINIPLSFVCLRYINWICGG